MREIINEVINKTSIAVLEPSPLTVLIGWECRVLSQLSKLLRLSIRARLMRIAVKSAAQVAIRATPPTVQAIPAELIPLLLCLPARMDGKFSTALDWDVGGLLILCLMGKVSKGKSHGGDLGSTWNLLPQKLLRMEEKKLVRFNNLTGMQVIMLSSTETLITYYKFGIDWNCFGITPLKSLSSMFLRADNEWTVVKNQIRTSCTILCQVVRGSLQLSQGKIRKVNNWSSEFIILQEPTDTNKKDGKIGKMYFPRMLLHNDHTHSPLRLFRDPKELGRSPSKLLYDRSLWQQNEIHSTKEKNACHAIMRCKKIQWNLPTSLFSLPLDLLN